MVMITCSIIELTALGRTGAETPYGPYFVQEAL
jgi:hypothetical protein